MNILEYPELLTTTEVAKILRIDKQTLKRWGKQKTPFTSQVKVVRINSRGDRRYLRSEIIKFLEKDEYNYPKPI